MSKKSMNFFIFQQQFQCEQLPRKLMEKSDSYAEFICKYKCYGRKKIYERPGREY